VKLVCCAKGVPGDGQGGIFGTYFNPDPYDPFCNRHGVFGNELLESHQEAGLQRNSATYCGHPSAPVSGSAPTVIAFGVPYDLTTSPVIANQMMYVAKANAFGITDTTSRNLANSGELQARSRYLPP
jgi:hypothetical protein